MTKLQNHQQAQQGWGQMTPAARAIMAPIFNGVRRSVKRSPKRATAARRAAPRPRKAAKGGKAAHLVRGSAAAKRHMARLRKMVGKRRRRA